MAGANPDLEKLAKQDYKYGFVTDIEEDRVAPGLTEDVVRLISAKKNEPEWLLDYRLKAYRRFREMLEEEGAHPEWAKVAYPQIDYDDIVYYSAPKQQNKIESLDPALIRPGRIDRKIEFPLPDVKTKRHIFNIHTSKMTLSEDVDLEKFIMSKDDLSGADIKAVCTEAGMLALRERRMKVCQEDFVKAKEKALYRKKGNIPEGLYL